MSLDAQGRTRGAILSAFPNLRAMPAEALRALVDNATTVHFSAGDRLIQPGDPCEACTLVIEGELRIHAESETGRALTLYSVLPGQMCAVTSLCLVSGNPFPAYVDAVEDTTALVLPRSDFNALLGTQQSWRAYAFGEAWARIDDLLTLIDSVVFTDLPTRLADAVLTAQKDGTVSLTHERLAADIGSSREVVSRVLKRWEGEGIVSLGRRQFFVKNPAALARIAQR